MDNREILERAIQKAIDNGWRPLKIFDRAKAISIQQWQEDHMVEVSILYEDDDQLKWMRELEGIIFDHSFAKALWGDGGEYSAGRLGLMPLWKWRLANMATVEDRIKYIGENI